MKSYERIVLRFVFLLLSLVILSGCGLSATQRKAVNNFSDSTATVGKIASDELINMRNQTINMNVHRIELAGLQKEHDGLDKLDGVFTPDRTRVFLQAVDALKSYGEGLLSLANDTQKENLSKASDKLVKSIESLPDSDKKIDKDQLDAIGKIIQAGGSLIVEEMKANAIKSIVNIYKEQVSYLCKKLMDDFNKDNNNSIIALPFYNTHESSIVVADEFVKKCATLDCRAKAMANFQEAMANRERSETVIKQISEALSKLSNANTELVNTINKNEISEKDIKEFSKSVKALIDAIKVLSKKL